MLPIVQLGLAEAYTEYHNAFFGVSHFLCTSGRCLNGFEETSIDLQRAIRSLGSVEIAGGERISAELQVVPLSWSISFSRIKDRYRTTEWQGTPLFCRWSARRCLEAINTSEAGPK